MREISDRLLAGGGTESVDAHLSEIRGFITKRLTDQNLISGESIQARQELQKHVSEIRMFPQDCDADTKPHYVAEGTWNLIGDGSDEGQVISAPVRSFAVPRNQFESIGYAI